MCQALPREQACPALKEIWTPVECFVNSPRRPIVGGVGVSGAVFACPRCGVRALVEPTPEGRFLKPDGRLVEMDCEERREWKRHGFVLTDVCPALAAEAARLRALAESR